MSAYPRPLVAVDVATFTVLDADLKILLVQRRDPPHGASLPGGFVRCGDGSAGQGEDLEAAARRELAEETRLGAMPGLMDEHTVALEQVGVFGAPDRDPRARVIAIAWLAVVRPELAAFVRAGGDASGVSWHAVARLREAPPLQFDHAAIVARALARLRRDVLLPRVARALVPDPFTLPELRAAVDAVLGTGAEQTRVAHVDAGNFRRRFLRMVDDGVVRPADGKRVSGRRPARVWSFAS